MIRQIIYQFVSSKNFILISILLNFIQIIQKLIKTHKQTKQNKRNKIINFHFARFHFLFSSKISRDTSSKKPWAPEEEEIKEKLLEMAKLPGNSTCCDCSCKRVSWASINIGCFLCYECAGQHRNLGTHISQVRSLTLDKWKPQWLNNMIGNEAVNRKYLARLPAGKTQPDEHDQSGREHWIKQKYQDKKWFSDIQVEQVSQNSQQNVQVGQISQESQKQEQSEQNQQIQQNQQQDLFANIFGVQDQQNQDTQQQQQQIVQQQVQQQTQVQQIQQNQIQEQIQEEQSVKQSSSTQQQINALDDLLGIFGEPIVEQQQQIIQKKRLQFDW